MKKIFKYIWCLICGIATIWGFLSPIWIILSYFNLFPFYEIKIKKTNNVELITNLFSGQDIQLDFSPFRYLDRSEINAVEWNITHLKENMLTLDGLRPILPIPKSIEGILNISVKVTLENHDVLEGYSNIYVVQKQNHKITTEFKKNINIGSHTLQNSLGFVNTNNPLENISEIEIYAKNNTWLKKKILISGNNYYINLNEGDQITTTNNNMILRISKSKNTFSYISIPFNKIISN